MFIFLSVINILILFYLKQKEKSKSKNLFSPNSVFIFFAFLPAFSNLYFSLNFENFKNIILSQISTEFHDPFFLHYSLFLTIINNLIIFFGINLGCKKKNFITIVLDNIFLSNKKIDYNFILKSSKFLYLLGVLVYLIFILKMGGLNEIWNNISLRSQKNAGLGYYQTFYTIAISFSSIILLFFSKNKLFKILITILTIFITISIGGRGQFIIFLFSALLFYHYYVKRLNSLFSFVNLSFIVLTITFILSVLQFRKYDFDYIIENRKVVQKNIISDFESGFLARIGRLERDMTIVGYFDRNNFWYGKSFLGLLSAPIPRSIFNDKPPVDSGMYLRSIALGRQITPPLPVNYLNSSSWPEHNWVGYMNFGIIGLFIVNLLSGFIFGSFYQNLNKSKINPFLLSFVSFFTVGGMIYLSPPGIVKMLVNLIIFFVFFRVSKFLFLK